MQNSADAGPGTGKNDDLGLTGPSVIRRMTRMVVTKSTAATAGHGPTWFSAGVYGNYPKSRAVCTVTYREAPKYVSRELRAGSLGSVIGNLRWGLRLSSHHALLCAVLFVHVAVRPAAMQKRC